MAELLVMITMNYYYCFGHYSTAGSDSGLPNDLRDEVI